MNARISFLIIALAMIAFSCGNSNIANNKEPAEPQKSLIIPKFNADSAYAYIEQQVNFGPRVPGTEAHTACASWLETTMERFADTVIVQSFKARAYNGEVLRGKNIIASYNVENKFTILLNTLNNLGINAERNQKNDILIKNVFFRGIVGWYR